MRVEYRSDIVGSRGVAEAWAYLAVVGAGLGGVAWAMVDSDCWQVRSAYRRVIVLFPDVRLFAGFDFVADDRVKYIARKFRVVDSLVLRFRVVSGVAGDV